MSVGHQAGAGSYWQSPHISNVSWVPGTLYEHCDEPTAAAALTLLAVLPIAASHDALHLTSEATAGSRKVRQPCAQDGCWQLEVVPSQQCPATAHFAWHASYGVAA